MSKKSVFKYFVNEDKVSIDSPEILSTSARRIVMVDADGDRLILSGHGLTFKGGALVSGVIDTLLGENHKGKDLLSLTHIDLDAATVIDGIAPDDLSEYAFLFGFRHNNLMLGSEGDDHLNGALGNDVIKGFFGDDHLAGSFGNDRLTGGIGSDYFQFVPGDGKDTITDFDADFNDGKQDYIEAVYDDLVGVKNIKGGVVLNFGHGDTLTLLGVKAADIDITDFVV